MELTQREEARVIKAVQDGKQIPDGEFITNYNLIELADALEREVNRARLLYDNPKIDLHMGVEDALLLCRLFRHVASR